MPFFPDATFGWVFYGIMLAFMLALVVTDLRIQRLPNAITMPMLLVGVVMNIIRSTIRVSETGYTVPGFLYGMGFSVLGIVVAFALFVILRQLGKCGAGDVKLMAAVGAWIGYLHFLFVFAGTIVAVVVVMLVWWGYAFTTKRNPGLKLSYALPCFISLSLLMLWFWRRDLF